jgi:hypothetical protein
VADDPINLEEYPKSHRIEIDIGSLAKADPKYNSRLTVESPEEAAARRELEAQKAAHKRSVHLISVYFALGMVSLIFLGCIVYLFVGSPDDKKWATGLIGAICTGLLAFVVGQKPD